MTSLLPSNPIKGSESCNHVAVSVLTAPTSGYGVFLCIPKEGAKMQYCNAWTSYTSNFNIKRIP
jgi:hypothetical protein